jgi:hypothetical protein
MKEGKYEERKKERQKERNIKETIKWWRGSDGERNEKQRKIKE